MPCPRAFETLFDAVARPGLGLFRRVFFEDDEGWEGSVLLPIDTISTSYALFVLARQLVLTLTSLDPTFCNIKT